MNPDFRVTAAARTRAVVLALAAACAVGACQSLWAELTTRFVAPGFGRGILMFMAFLPNGHLLTVQRPFELRTDQPPSQAGPATAFVINPATGGEVRRFDVVAAHFALSADGRLLAGAVRDERLVKIWDLSGRLLHSLDLPRATWSVAFSPDGRQLAADSDGGPLLVWDTRTGERLTSLSAPCLPPQSELQWSGDGRRLIASSRCVFELATGTVIEADVAAGLASVDREGRRIATATEEGGWVLDGGRRQRLVGAAEPVAISPDGRLVAGPLDVAGRLGVGAFGIWDASTGQLRSRLAASCLPVERVLFSPDSRTVVAVFPRDEGRLYDAVQGRSIRTWNEPDCSERHWATREPRLAFSPDGRFLVVGDSDGALRLRDLSGVVAPTPSVPPAGPPIGAPRIVAPPPRPAEFGGLIEVLGGLGPSSPLATALSPDGQSVAVTLSDGSVRVWDVASGKLRGTWPVAAPGGLVTWPGRWLYAAGAEGAIHILEPASPRTLRSVGGDTGPEEAMAASADGRWIATFGKDDRLRLREGASGKVLFTDAAVRRDVAPQIQALEFSPTGGELYTVALARSDVAGEITRWSLADPAAPVRKVLLSLPRGSSAATIHPRSETVAAARGETIAIADVRSGSLSRTISAPAVVDSLTFSPDGSLLAVTFDNGRGEPMANRIQLWDVASGSLAATIGRHSGSSCGNSRVTFSADGRRLAERDACVYGNVNVYDVARRDRRTPPPKEGSTP